MITSAPAPAPLPGGGSGPPAFSGDFETHITVRTGRDGLSALARHASARGMKFAHIVLARGRTPSQPMVTLNGSGPLADVAAGARAAAAGLRAAGFDVVRVKIEAAPWTDGVPADDARAAELGPRYYFEHHVKLLLDAGSDTAALARLSTGHGAHLSWNARRVREDGRAERFVTQRCGPVGLGTAGRRLDALVAALRSAGHEPVSVEREFVVFDSDASLDEGWIGEEAGEEEGGAAA
ncbi:hypothetical protein GCM10010406_32530 [Streptomyces thermolineatus]|uniref:Ankyrin n=1 Tax=Streptomyces thermolineatus TaxID=44033 RepID=A0ABP5Z7S2_9ACTN